MKTATLTRRLAIDTGGLDRDGGVVEERRECQRIRPTGDQPRVFRPTMPNSALELRLPRLSL